MKKILFISSRPIFPIMGGDQIRTFQSLRLLHQYFHVDIISIIPNEEPADIVAQYLEYGNYTSFKISKWRHWINALKFLINDLPIQVNYYYSKKVQQYIDCNIHTYEVVYCNNLRTSEYVRKYMGINKIIDFVDAISMNYEKARFKTSGVMRLIYNIDYHRCMRYESLLLNEFQTASVISSIDAQYILSHTGLKKEICIVGNMVECREKSKCVDKKKNAIVFVGKMSYEPNITAVCNFARNIFPKIKKQNADLVFYIVGATPDRSVLKLDNSKDIIVTGFVTDVNESFETASIVIAPMLSGAGIQNKIIQAMSLGCCVVTTTIGAEGLMIHNNEISIMDGNDNIANEIIRLLQNDLEREEMGKKAVAYVKANLTHKAVAKQFYQLISPFLE